MPLWWKALGLLETMALTEVQMNILTLRGVGGLGLGMLLGKLRKIKFI